MEDLLSTNLFTSVLEEIFKEMVWDDSGISINGDKLHNLRFADDIILLSRSIEELKRMGEDREQN